MSALQNHDFYDHINDNSKKLSSENVLLLFSQFLETFGHVDTDCASQVQREWVKFCEEKNIDVEDAQNALNEQILVFSVQDGEYFCIPANHEIGKALRNLVHLNICSGQPSEIVMSFIDIIRLTPRQIPNNKSMIKPQ